MYFDGVLTYDTFSELLGPWQYSTSILRIFGHNQDYQKCIICRGTMTKKPIKTPKILKNPNFWTFLSFLIFLMVTKYLRSPFYTFAMSQESQKCIICGVSMKNPHQGTQHPPKLKIY